MSVDDPMDDKLARQQAHDRSGLADRTLMDRYVERRDLVAFVDETHRQAESGKSAYYGLAVTVFHADDLPEIRIDLRAIAGNTYWHATEAYQDLEQRGTIAQVNQYVAERTALPVAVFEVRNRNFSPADERAVRDACLDQTLRALDREFVTDVVMETFTASEAHNVDQDQFVLKKLRGAGVVSDEMWIHHASTGKERALWAPDAVAWSLQRHHFGQREGDSTHIAPLAGTLREVHAFTGAERVFPVVSPKAHTDRRAARAMPLGALAAKVETARAAYRRGEPPTLEDGPRRQPPHRPGPPPPTRS